MNDDDSQRRRLWILRQKNARTILLVLLLACCLFALSFQLPSIKPAGKVEVNEMVTKVLVVVNRHGARTALQHYAFEDFTWDDPLGQLTVHGLMQAFDFGTMLRKRMLVRELDRLPFTKFAAYATYLERTVETARSMILGMVHGDRSSLFPGHSNCTCRVTEHPATYSCIEKCIGVPHSLQWTDPLPNVTIIDRDSDKIGWMMQYDRCQGLPEKIEAIRQSTEFDETVHARFQSELDLLHQIIGADEACMDQISSRDRSRKQCGTINMDMLEQVWDDLVAANDAKKDTLILKGRESQVMSTLKEAVQWKWNIEFNKEHGKVAGGILLDEILNRIETIVRESPKQTTPLRRHVPVLFENDEFLHSIIFSGHDKTIASMLSVLGAERWPLPEYLAHIVLVIKGRVDSRRLEDHMIEIEYNDEPLSTDSCPVAGCSLVAFMDNVKEKRVPLESCIMRP